MKVKKAKQEKNKINLKRLFCIIMLFMMMFTGCGSSDNPLELTDSEMAALPDLSINVPGNSSALLSETAFESTLGSLVDQVGDVMVKLGEVVTLWGISEWGISFMSTEGTASANAFKRIAGGLVMMLTPEILSILIS